MTPKELIKKATENKSLKFNKYGEDFKLFIDWSNQLCLTHFSENGENCWAIYNEEQLTTRLRFLTGAL